jgi:hypothetical protein
MRMAKRRQAARKGARDATTAGKAPARASPDGAAENRAFEDQVSAGALSLHQLFEQQARQMLDRTDLDEEQKQNVLVAMSCPCCGAGAMSFTVKLKR